MYYEWVENINKISSDISKQKEVYDASNTKVETILIPKITMEKDEIKEMPKAVDQRRRGRKGIKIIKIIAIVLLVFVIITGFLFWGVYKDAMDVKAQAQRLKDSLSQKDLNVTSSELVKIKDDLNRLDKSYSKLAFTKIIPFIGSFYRDGEHIINASFHGIDSGEILLDSVKPYADIIGFKGTGNEETRIVRTAQDKIDFIIKTMPEIVPKIDGLSGKVNLMNEEIDKINPDRYPKTVRGIIVRDNLVRGKELLGTIAGLIEDGKPLLENTDYFLGVESPRTYMVIFQNDKELRPTGGFITAYTIARVDKGRFDPISSDDIYDLDNKYTPVIKAPEQFPKYLKGIYVALNRFRLRDMNWSPDFEESMNMFSTEIKKVGVKNIDGIIAVDTQMLVYLLDVLGKVSVPGYGDFSTNIVSECKCPQVIYELESFADNEGAVVWSENEPGKIVFAPENYGERKKIIGPLMNSILSATLGLPDEKMPLLFEAVVKSFTQKHALFYLFDEEAESAVKAFGIGGEIKNYPNGDYLYINDANLGGRKSNLYVTQEIVYEVNKKDGYIENDLTITYKNPEKQDGWLNSVLPNWVRIYVPKGSEVLENDGFGEFVAPYEEYGKTVFAGFVSVRPQGVSKVSIKYKVPLKLDREYKLYIQKQPGKDAPLYSISFGKLSEEFSLKTDKEIRL